MIILHAGQYDGHLALWGEVSWEGHVDFVSQSPRKKTSRAVLHPFAAGIDDLLGALKEAVPGFKHGTKWICSMAAWLPTIRTGPVPSSDIIYDLPKSRTKAKIVPWAVAGYMLSAGVVARVVGSACRRRSCILGRRAASCRFNGDTAAVSS